MFFFAAFGLIILRKKVGFLGGGGLANKRIATRGETYWFFREVMVSHTFEIFVWGNYIQFALRIFLKWVGEKTPSSFVGCLKILVVEGRSVW